MDVILVLLVLLLAAIATMPVWSYSAKWKLYPSSACLGLAMIGAMLVAVGVI